MKFSSQQTVCTCGISDRIAEDAKFSLFVLNSLKRHFSCDWGDSPKEDCLANDMALATDDRILSAYIQKTSGRKIWIITEHDRTVTTVLYPEEY
jgi:hypothetical protein